MALTFIFCSIWYQVLEHYVSNVIMSVITTFFNSRFSEQSTTVQARQPVFVKLLQGAYRLSHSEWLTGSQKYHVETCIRTLSEIGKLYDCLLVSASAAFTISAGVSVCCVCHVFCVCCIHSVCSYLQYLLRLLQSDIVIRHNFYLSLSHPYDNMYAFLRL